MTQDELINEATRLIVNNIDRWQQEYGDHPGEHLTVEDYDQYIGNHVRAVVSMLAYRSHDIGWYAALRHTHDLAKDIECELDDCVSLGLFGHDCKHGFNRCIEMIEQVISEEQEPKE